MEIVKSHLLGILGGFVESLCLCCGMKKWPCVIVHHCSASLCHCLAAVQHRSLTPYCFFGGGGVSPSLPVSQTWVFRRRKKKAHWIQIWSINKETRRKRGQRFQPSLTVSSLSHLCWRWKVVIGILNVDLCIPAPLCACFYDGSASPKDGRFQQLTCFFFAAEAIP